MVRQSAETYDLLVVGAGVAGSEAAWAAAQHGRRVLLVTTSLDTVYNLVGDGADLAPPAGSLMVQAAAAVERQDGLVGSWALHRQVKYALEREPSLHLLQSSVAGLLVEQGRVVGVSTWEGVDRFATSVALCVGSFLDAKLTIGSSVESAGRLSEMAYDDLYLDLVAKGFGFAPLRLRAPAASGSLAYEVQCRTLAVAEWDQASFRLPRLAGLYAAGLCAAGQLTYEQAAVQGQSLGRLLSAGALA